MTHSMTAFARQTAEYPWGALVWEIRSVNHRYLEPAFKLPEPVRWLEGELRERLREHVARGKIECSLRLQRSAATKAGLSVDENFLAQLLVSARIVEKQLGASTPLNALQLLAWPGVLVEVDNEDDTVNQLVVKLFEQTLAQLAEHRAREGAALKQFIEAQLDAAATITDGVRLQIPQILAAQRQKLRDRLQEFSGELNRDRVEQELLILAQKCDVAEELDRLQTHIKEVRRTLQQREPCGRRLDFLMQELNREANTLSSKSLASETSQFAVQLKVLIEQMREQVQNIE
jgi:uncharacterized protein (TIGR00255 family)